MKLAFCFALLAGAAAADPLGFLDMDVVGAPYVEGLVDQGDGISVAPAQDGLVLVRVDTGEQFICDPRPELSLGSAMMRMVDIQEAEGRGCLAFARIEDIMISVNLRNDVAVAYAERLGPEYDLFDVDERISQAVRSLLRMDVPCSAYPQDFLALSTNPEFVAAVSAAIEREGLPVQNCPFDVALP